MDGAAGSSASARRHPLYTVMSALPLAMLVVGIAIYYFGESQQSAAEPIVAEARELRGLAAGTSVLGAGEAAQHFFWLDTDRGQRSVRITPEQHALLAGFEKGGRVVVSAAPTISGSKKLWLLSLEDDAGEVLPLTR